MIIRHIATGIAALLLATGTAHAQRPTYISLPPAEYDKPYVGKLRIIRIDTEESLRAECPTSEYACSSPASAVTNLVAGARTFEVV
jgi:hypothetical protein